MIKYNIKAIVSGNVFEFYKYEDTIYQGYSRERKKSPERIESRAAVESRGRSNIRARNNLRRLALSNFNNKSKFLTLI